MAESTRKSLLYRFSGVIIPAIGHRPAAGLNHRHIDFLRRILYVRSAKKGEPPKREIPLRNDLVKILKKWFREDGKNEDRHVITFRGHPVRAIQRAWVATKKRACITRRIRLYDIRHAAITTMLQYDQADLKTISEIAGHATPQFTLAIYAHSNNTMARAAVNSIKIPGQ